MKNIRSLLFILTLIAPNPTSHAALSHQPKLTLKITGQDIVNDVRKLSSIEIINVFEQLRKHDESFYKMAVRLVFAKDHKKNIDDKLDCLFFINNIQSWVNGQAYKISTPLLGPNYLQFVLPLLEPIIREPVKMLNLCRNNLRELPSTIEQLPNLEVLLLSDNKLSTLPDVIGKLGKLKLLDLCHNELIKLPDSFCLLSALEDLMLAANKLKELPEEFGRLGNLRDLYLNANNFVKLPYSIRNLTKLKRLGIDDRLEPLLPATLCNKPDLTISKY